MNLTKACMICGISLARSTCSSCGKLVCTEHFVLNKHICTDCFSLIADE